MRLALPFHSILLIDSIFNSFKATYYRQNCIKPNQFKLDGFCKQANYIIFFALKWKMLPVLQ